ncbi:MAG: glycosyltransferase family A protein, partial [Anaerolineales bacterium]|nr:glycosyltransferase family A protein [Anaerolineales bacterium]
MTTVTVLMPVYNGTRYLREAIDSILKQTFEDFEFLIIDDASTDESASVILSYSDERIRFVQNKSNVGQVRCQNIGLDLARGQYIARLDQDDSSLATRLRRQVDLMESDPRLAVVGTWMSKVDENGHEMD